MIGGLRQLSEPRLIQQARIEKSQTPVERDILVQWVRKTSILLEAAILSIRPDSKWDSTCKEINLLLLFFSFRVDPLLKGFVYPEKKTGSHESYSPL